MANSYEVRAQKFIQQIFPMIEDFTDEDTVINNVHMFNLLNHRKVRVASGLTRIALISSDYVIKFDYNNYNVSIWGGCENEIELYHQAETDGFDYLFAKITRYEYQGYKFYIMPRVYGIGRKEEDAWDYMTEEESDWCEDHNLCDLHSFNYGWRNGHICLIDYGASC